MDDLNVLRIEDFYGGISPRIHKGVRGSFAYGQNLDIRENNTLKCSQALVKDSGTVVTDLPNVIIKTINGRYFAFGNTGKIYRRIKLNNATYPWVLVYTDPDGEEITGAIEYKSTSDSYILYATARRLKKITVTNAEYASGDHWTGNVTTVAIFLHGLTISSGGTGHPMRYFNGGIVVADEEIVGYYGFDDTYNSAALTLPVGMPMKVFLDRNDRLIQGTNNSNAMFLTWDGLSPSWLTKKSAQGNGINGMEFYEGGIVAQVGQKGYLKYWNFAETSPLTRVPGTLTVNPNGMVVHGGLVHMGMNGGTKNGVYTLGRLDLNDPRALNLEYIPSHGKLTGTEIGCVFSDGTNLLVSWKDGTTYGIDILSTTVKADAVYESLVYNLDKSEQEKMIRHIKITLKDPLPTGCSVGLDYKASRVTDEEETAADATGWIPTKMSDDRELINVAGETKGVFDVEALGESVQFRIRMYHSENTTPEINSVNIYFDYNNGI